MSVEKYMLRNKKIGVVIPAYNEEKLITVTIETIPAFVDLVIVVDDHSLDRTAQIVETSQRENLIMVRHQANMGVGKAILTGYEEAVSQGCHVIAVMGGDNQMDPADLQVLLLLVLSGESDYAKGNRFLSSGWIKAMPNLRILGNICFSVLSCIASGYYTIFDTQCGYTAINAETLRKLDIDSLIHRYGFPTDMLAKLNMIGARVVDVPVKAIYKNEKSGIRPLHYTIKLLSLTVKLYIERQYRKIRFLKKLPAP